MLQFVVRRDGSEEARSVTCAQVPFVIGRASTADFQLSAPGVWDRHAEVLEDGSGKFLLRPLGDAIVLVNGVRSSGRLLIPGDEVQLGGACLAVGLAPVQQKKLSIAEGIVWFILALVTAGELAAIFVLR